MKRRVQSKDKKMTNLYGDKTELNDSLSIKDHSIIEFIHSYKVESMYLSQIW